jgi:hypothetical protein
MQTNFIFNKKLYVIFFFLDDCPPQWHKYSHNCYIVHKKQYGITWIEAENECQSFGGHLVSIDGRSEMEFLHYLITVVVNGLDGDRAYIGMWLNEKFLVLLLLQLINKFDFKKLLYFLTDFKVSRYFNEHSVVVIYILLISI